MKLLYLCMYYVVLHILLLNQPRQSWLFACQKSLSVAAGWKNDFYHVHQTFREHKPKRRVTSSLKSYKKYESTTTQSGKILPKVSSGV
mgnify:FL=1